jgi:hypothetical protein
MLEWAGAGARAGTRFKAACVLTAGNSIPASTLSFEGNHRAGTIEFKKVVGGLKAETTFMIDDITNEVVEAEIELFVIEAFPSAAI